MFILKIRAKIKMIHSITYLYGLRGIQKELKFKCLDEFVSV